MSEKEVCLPNLQSHLHKLGPNDLLWYFQCFQSLSPLPKRSTAKAFVKKSQNNPTNSASWVRALKELRRFYTAWTYWVHLAAIREPVWDNRDRMFLHQPRCSKLQRSGEIWFRVLVQAQPFTGLEGVSHCVPGECTSHKIHHSDRRFLCRPLIDELWQRHSCPVMSTLSPQIPLAQYQPG